LVQELLESAGIVVGGPHPGDIQVHDDRFYDRVLAESALGLGESYMDGWWDCEAVDQFMDRLLRARIDRRVRGNWRIAFHSIRSRLLNLQTRSRSYRVAERHYDLGNDFYRAMLGPTMQYTCAYFRDGDDLDAAQEAKMDLVCRKLELQPGMKVLELGCGFGMFARFAAERYGVSVRAYNISQEQVRFASEACRGLPVEVLQADYRDAQGRFDRVVSIGIMEHVGYKNYRTYMEVVDRCLAEDGVALIHTIGGNESTTTANAWITKYIFPGGMLPSISQLAEAMEGLFVVEDLHNIGPHYDPTLMAWYANFVRAWPEFADRLGERFFRMWSYYLLSCAGGFRSRDIQLWQIVFTRPGRRQPPRLS